MDVKAFCSRVIPKACRALRVFNGRSKHSEERRRTGRYIAILIGICLLMLAIYHAWVRRIPVVASLVVPALIMFVYVGWVLYTASKDKKRLLLLDAEAALNAAAENAEDQTSDVISQNNIEIAVITSKENSNVNSPEENHTWAEVCANLLKEDNVKVENKRPAFIKPIILVNDKPTEDLDEKWTYILETLYGNDNLKGYQRRRKFKRKYCRRRRNAAFKRSYSIG